MDICNVKQADVCLVMPPVAFGCMPSFALGILKACLNRENISCYVDYANMHFVHAMGMAAFAAIYHGSLHGFLGEYIFNEAAGIENGYTVDDFVRYQFGDKDNITDHLYMKNAVLHAVRVANEETKRTVERILARKPKMVGCTAVFEQRNASLAILRRIKERCPEIKTFMGGFACFEYGGMAMLRQFPFLDLVFCGESDDIFADVCKRMMDGDLSELPYGVLRQGDPFPDKPPHRIVSDLDSVPCPDYDDYMEMINSWFGIEQYEMVGKRAEMRLILETSRGCWWGAKHPCAFCGLNGQTKCFRRKSPEKVIEEIREITEKYDNGYICFADNILPNEWFTQVLPQLKEMNKGSYFFTVEIKSNVREAQIKELREAGYAVIQPGIESLSDRILQLLDKGVTGIQNIALLKYSKKHDMVILWNILTGVVGENEEDYRLHTEIIPLIEHYQPPKNYSDIIYMRNSVYYDESEKYGLKLAVDPVFRFISPDNEEYINNIAFHFIDENRTTNKDPFITIAKMGFKSAVDKWNRRWKGGGQFVRFDVYDEDGVLYLTDNRTMSSERNIRLDRIYRDIYLAASEPAHRKKICTVLDSYDESEIDKALDELCRRGLLLHLSGKYLALAIEITKDKAMELSYREFFMRLFSDEKLRSALSRKSENGGSTEELIAGLGRENGYIFDAQTVLCTDLIPERKKMDLIN